MKSIPENAVHPLTRAEWRSWLMQNHARSEGIWLITYRKATAKPRIDYDEAVEEALYFGWIDRLNNPFKYDNTTRYSLTQR